MNRARVITEVETYLKEPEVIQKVSRESVLENEIFFHSARNPLSYVLWLLKRATRINPSTLLELSDLPNSEQWGSLMYERLIPVQRKKIPGLIEPIVGNMTEFILKKNSDTVILGLGAGPMEIERQVIGRLKKNAHKNKVKFVGCDISSKASEFARKNLFDSLDEQYSVEFIKGDVLSFPQEIFDVKCDLVYHSLFRHHLSDEKKHVLDETVEKLHTHVLEYDGYRSVPNLIPQSIMAWGNPIFLNAAIFSNLRFIPKSSVISRADKLGVKASLYNIGNYLLEYNTQ